MKKKHLIFIFLPLICTVFLVIFLQRPTEGQIIESGSKNSRIDSLPKSEEIIQENLPITTDCFEVKNTQNITSIKQESSENSCVIRAMLIEPIGQITVSAEKIDTTNITQNLSDNTGVKLREKNTETYTQIQEILAVPQPFELSQTEQLQTKVFTTNTEITGFFFDVKSNTLLVVSIHSVATMNEKIFTQFWQIVGSARMNL
ncbi:hypothetical protein KA017_00210 [Candidatus Woesebacteria bacterium]|nr:hypothetical protein [Candidatus Woesebacteria bacterium]